MTSNLHNQLHVNFCVNFLDLIQSELSTDDFGWILSESDWISLSLLIFLLIFVIRFNQNQPVHKFRFFFVWINPTFIPGYVDDTVVPIDGDIWTLLASNMSNKLTSISSWLYQNHLFLNVEKSVFVTCGNYCDSVPEIIEIKIIEIEIKHTKKYWCVFRLKLIF